MNNTDIFKTVKPNEEGFKTKLYMFNGNGFFWDTHRREWVLYPVNEKGERIEWNEHDEPIEAQYFNNKKELLEYLNKK